MTVPYTFANATGSLPLVELDLNFASISNSVSNATGNITFNDTTISTLTANNNITVATSSGNTTSNWVFGSNGNLTLPGTINSTNSIAITANTTGAANIILTANGAAGNSTFVFDSSGNLTSPGNVYAPAFIGSGEYLGNLLLNSTIGNIVLDLANTDANVANIDANVANTDANVATFTSGLANTNANVANTNSNVANLTLDVANITANIGNLQANNYSNINTSAYLKVYGGNIYSNNINSFGNVGGYYVYSSQDITAGGNLYVNGTDTIIDSTQITSNVNTLTLNHDVIAGNISDLDGSGLFLGNSLVSWIYDYPSNSWQTNVNIETYTGVGNLGSQYNPWGNIFASNVIVSGAFNTTSVVANVANIGDLVVRNTASIVSLAVSSDANVTGTLRVASNSTIIDGTSISSNVSTLILDKDNSTGLLADGAGIQIGSGPAVATLLFNNDTGSWQSSIDITPSTDGVANLGNTGNQWNTVYSTNIETSTVNTTDVNAVNVYSDLVYSNIVYGNAVIGIDASVSGNVVANVVSAISLVGLVTTNTQPNITSLGNLISLTVVGNITGSYIYGNGYYLTGMPELYGNANVANYLPLYSGNLDSVNNITANIVTANFFIGDGSQITNVAAVTANTVVDNSQPNITSVGNLTALTVAGNATANYVFANGAVFNNDISVTGNIIAGNINANVTGTITEAINVTGNAQPNITSVGNLTSLTVTGNATANYYFGDGSQLTGIATTLSGNLEGNITANGYYINDLPELSVTGNITSNSFFIGNGAYLTGLPSSYSNADVANYLPTYSGNIANLTVTGTVNSIGNITANYFIGNGSQLTGLPSSYSNADVANYLPTYSGNLDSVNNITANIVTANFFIGDGSQLTGTYGNSNVANYIPTYNGTVGNLASTGTLSAAGNINANAMYINGDAVIVGSANIQGNLTYNNLTNLTTDNLVLGLGNNQVGSFVTGAGIAVGNTNEATLLYDFTTQSWNSNINFLVSGNVNASGNISGVYFNGDGSNVSNVVALTVSDATQPNITSLGSLTSLTVVGNTLSGNFFTDNRISATGNIESAGNISADYFIGNGSELTDIVANVSQLINGSYTVELDSAGVLQYSNVNDQQQALTGTTTTVYGDPYTKQVNSGLLEIIWTATTANVVGFKMTTRAQYGNSTINNVEIADIACSSDGTLANTSYTISNRVKNNQAYPDMIYRVLFDGVNRLIVQANNVSNTQAYFTHSVTEFNKTL